MDNLAAHKRAEVAIAIEAAGARLLYLPPYSPDLNPIEMAFAKLKAALRKAAARSIEALVNAIAARLDRLHRPRVSQLLRRAGYDRVSLSPPERRADSVDHVLHGERGEDHAEQARQHHVAGDAEQPLDPLPRQEYDQAAATTTR